MIYTRPFLEKKPEVRAMSEDFSQSLIEDPIAPIAQDEIAQFQEEDKPKGDPLSIVDFDEQAACLKAPEERLRFALQFMRTALNQTGAPYFKGFWHARSFATSLFKENLPPSLRGDLWKEYRDLCSEFRKLKEVLDEHAAFAAEQIEIAIKATFHELEHFEEQIEKQPSLEFPFKCQTLEKNYEIYNTLQKELVLLNAYALRINGLRKELIKTEMRIRVKNKFFKELSLLGDKVFPKRKDLIKTLSQQFISDVESFTARNFNDKAVKGAFFFLREEIKALQSIAKVLTLNTHAFTVTRTHLSECWDLVKAADKDKKKEFAEKRSIFKQNENQVSIEIQKLKDDIDAGNVKSADLNPRIEEIIQLMRSLELGKEERHSLKEALSNAQKPILDKIKQEEEERAQLARAAVKLRIEKIEAFKNSIVSLLNDEAKLDANELEAKREELSRELLQLPAQRNEKQLLEKLLKSLKDLVSEKREKALLDLSEDDQSHLSKLKDALKEREVRHKEIKDHLEELRRMKGNSSLSFEKALTFNETVQEERERLQKIEASIEEIENKIFELSSKAHKT